MIVKVYPSPPLLLFNIFELPDIPFPAGQIADAGHADTAAIRHFLWGKPGNWWLPSKLTTGTWNWRAFCKNEIFNKFGNHHLQVLDDESLVDVQVLDVMSSEGCERMDVRGLSQLSAPWDHIHAPRTRCSYKTMNPCCWGVFNDCFRLRFRQLGRLKHRKKR